MVVVLVAAQGGLQRASKGLKDAFDLVVFVLAGGADVEVEPGRIAKRFEEVAEQFGGHVADALAAEISKEAGGTVAVRRFVRYERGEGIEKGGSDFAAEVAKLAGTLRSSVARL